MPLIDRVRMTIDGSTDAVTCRQARSTEYSVEENVRKRRVEVRIPTPNYSTYLVHLPIYLSKRDNVQVDHSGTVSMYRTPAQTRDGLELDVNYVVRLRVGKLDPAIETRLRDGSLRSYWAETWRYRRGLYDLVASVYGSPAYVLPLISPHGPRQIKTAAGD
ncbi:hypothetical protein LZ30DRAFT_688884 [Colletotrichum cereale]|nr:hypothetical protein LZ30DRAFT_688884 [Colletotrichum cereale]